MTEFHRADVGVLNSITRRDGRMSIAGGRRDWSGLAVGCGCARARGEGDGEKVVGGDGGGAGAPGFGRLALDLAHDGRAVVSIVTGCGEPVWVSITYGQGLGRYLAPM